MDVEKLVQNRFPLLLRGIIPHEPLGNGYGRPALRFPVLIRCDAILGKRTAQLYLVIPEPEQISQRPNIRLPISVLLVVQRFDSSFKHRMISSTWRSIRACLRSSSHPRTWTTAEERRTAPMIYKKIIHHVMRHPDRVHGLYPGNHGNGGFSSCRSHAGRSPPHAHPASCDPRSR